MVIRRLSLPPDQLVQYIYPPEYECVSSNQGETTFGRICITVGLLRYKFDSQEVLQDEVKNIGVKYIIKLSKKQKVIVSSKNAVYQSPLLN